MGFFSVCDVLLNLLFCFVFIFNAYGVFFKYIPTGTRVCVNAMKQRINLLK